MAELRLSVSYRREDEPSFAGRLRDRLAGEYGDQNVFFDVDDIPPGVDYRQVIRETLRDVDAVILVIGPRWDSARLQAPHDPVRLEVAETLHQKKVLVPVLVGETPIPEPDELPKALQRIAYLNAPRIRPADFHRDASRLLEGLQEAVHWYRDRSKTPASRSVPDTRRSAQDHFDHAEARADDDLDGRLADYDEAIRLNPEFAEALKERAKARRKKGEYAGEIADYTEVVRLRAGEIADYTEAIRLRPEDADAYAGRASARHRGGDNDGAIADYTEAIRLDPTDADAYAGRAGMRAIALDKDRAMADYTEAIRLNPHDAALFTNRASIRGWTFNNPDPDGVLDDLNEGIRLEPDNSVALFSRGIARENRGDLDGALADYDDSLHFFADESVFLTRADLRRKQGDLDGAIDDYSEALQLADADDTRFDAFKGRALARRDAGELESAIADAEEGIRLDPGNDELEELLADLRKAAKRKRK